MGQSLATLKLQLEVDGSGKVVGEINNVSGAISSLGSNTHETVGLMDASFGRLAATFAAGNLIASGIELIIASLRRIPEEAMAGVAAIDSLRVSTIQIAAQITTMQGPKNVAEHYQAASKYAEVLALKLQDVDAKSFANYQNLMAMTQTMTLQGVVMDVNNKKQVDSFTALSNAVAMYTQGQNQSIQFHQEIRALMSGEVNQGSQLARQIDDLIKRQGNYADGLKGLVAEGKKHGDTLERLAPYLVGINAATGDIEKTWQAVTSSAETAKFKIQSIVFADVYKDAIKYGGEFVSFLKNNATEIGEGIKTTFSALSLIGGTLLTSNLTSRVISFAESLAITSQHAQALRMNTIFNAEALVAETSAAVASTQAKIADNQATLSAIAAARAEYTAQLQVTTSVQGRAIITRELITLGEQQIRVNAAIAASEMELATATTAAGAAQIELATAQAAASMTGRVMTGVMSGLNVVMGLVGGTIGAITIGVGVFTYAIIKFNDRANEAQRNLEKLRSNGDMSQQIQKVIELEKLLHTAQYENKTPEAKAEDARSENVRKTNAALQENVQLEARRAELIKRHGSSWTAANTFWGKPTELDQINAKIRDNNDRIRNGSQITEERIKLEKQLEDERKKAMATVPSQTLPTDKTAEYNLDMQEKFRKSYEAINQAYDRAEIEQAKQAAAQKQEILKNQYDAGLISQQAYLDAKYQAQAAAEDREIAQLTAAAERITREYNAAKAKVPAAMPNGADHVAVEMYNKAILTTNDLLKQKIDAWTKVDKAEGQASQNAIKHEGESAAITRANNKTLLDTESQILSMAGATYQATLKQIEADKLSRKPIDAKTDALRDQLDALKKLKAKQDEANALNAIKGHTEDTNISMMGSDPYAQQMAQIQKRYDEEARRIQQNQAMLAAANKQQSDEYKALSADLLATAAKREQEIATIQRQQSEAGWQGVVKAAQNAFPALTGLDKAVTAAFTDHTKYRKATQEELSKGSQKYVKDETRSNLSMYSSYTGAAGALFEGMAQAQDQSSKRGFETAKAYNIAAAIMNTASGIMAQFAGPDGWSPTAWVRSGIVAAMGAIQIAQIASTSFGGSASIVAPSGSFAGSSGGAAGNSFTNLAKPLTSITDSRTEETYQRLLASNDNVAVAIGRLSKSMDDLSALFKTGGAAYGLVANAPGSGTALTDMPTVWDNIYQGSGLKVIVDVFSALRSGSVSNVLRSLDPTSIAKNIISSMFGGKTGVTGAGFTLEVKDGSVLAQDYTDYKKSGGLFKRSSSWSTYSDNADLASYMNALMGGWVADIGNMAKTLGADFNASAYDQGSVRIATANRTEEQISKDLETWMTSVLQGMSMTVEGLQENVGAWDDAYAMLKKYNDALVTANNAFMLIGKSTVEGSFANAKLLDSLQTLMGGLDGFTESVDTYFSSMFTDVEQEAAKAEAAQRQVNTAFIEMGMAVPASRAEFRSLVNGLDMTTESGALAFAQLMSVAEAFGTVADHADDLAEQAKKVADGMQDLNVRYLSATGQDTAADALSRQLDAQREIEQAIADNMGDAYITRLREVLDAESRATAITDTYNTALTTLNDSLSAINSTISTLTGYVNKLNSASQRMQLQDTTYQQAQYQSAQAVLAATLTAARSGDLTGIASLDDTLSVLTQRTAESYANSTDYQRDFWQTKSSIEELATLAGSQLTDAQKQADLLQQQIDNSKDQLNVLLNINTSVLSVADAIAAITGISDSSLLSLPRFADGGITSGISIAGEAGPEAVIPLPDGRRVPVQMTGQADSDLLAEIRALRQEVALLRSATGEVSRATQRTAKLIDQWDGDGMPEVRAA